MPGFQRFILLNRRAKTYLDWYKKERFVDGNMALKEEKVKRKLLFLSIKTIYRVQLLENG